MLTGNIEIGAILLQYFCLLFSLCVHEAAHAAMANQCGDPSARLMGRMSIDPRKHIDPLGTVILPLFMMITSSPYLFGWAKPVPFNLRNLGNMRRDPVLIALAGPISNIFIALTSAILMRVLLLLVVNDIAVPNPEIFLKFLGSMIIINVVLALFNMIPLPPLDGHHVLYYFLPQSGKDMLMRLGPFGIIIAIVLLAPLLSTPMILCFYFFLMIGAQGLVDIPQLMGIILA